MTDPNLVMPCPPPGVFLMVSLGVLSGAIASEIPDEARWIKAVVFGVAIAMPVLGLVSWLVGAISGHHK